MRPASYSASPPRRRSRWPTAPGTSATGSPTPARPGPAWDGSPAPASAPSDRRRHLVRLTPDGEKMLRRLRTLSAEIEDGFLSPLSDKERATLHGLLFRLAEEHDPRCGPIGAPGLTV